MIDPSRPGFQAAALVRGPTPPVVRTKSAIAGMVRDWRRAGHSVGFVPTMGALHAGHLRLVAEAKARVDRVIASIFVNPTQFAAHEDLGSYPRNESGDLAKLASVDCDLVYCPTLEEMYANGNTTRVRVEGVARDLETSFRPQFFEGVATVVTKLFHQVTPDIAFFGEKDFQQLQVIKALVHDLDIPVEIVGVPTVRDPDGLALSSRNAYLTPSERSLASHLPALLAECASRISNGADISVAVAGCAESLLLAGFRQVDYVEVRHPATLERLPSPRLDPGQSARLLAAAWLGKTRLIDNVGVERAAAPDESMKS